LNGAAFFMLAYDSLLFRTLSSVALAFAIVAALSYAASFFIPIIVALFLAVFLHLPLNAMQRHGFPRWLGSTVLVIALSGLCLLFALFVLEPAQQFAREYPNMMSELKYKASALRQSLSEAEAVSDAISEVGDEVDDALADDQVQEVVIREENLIMKAASTVASSLSTVLVTLVITAFIMAIRRPFLVLATAPYDRISHKLAAARLWLSMETHIARYFFTVTIINTCLGIAVGISLWALGVPMPVFWGVVVGFLNYMPYVGPAIGAA